jgi:hypothetical protein
MTDFNGFYAMIVGGATVTTEATALTYSPTTREVMAQVPASNTCVSGDARHSTGENQ